MKFVDVQTGPASGIGDTGSCLGCKMTGGHRIILFLSEVHPLVSDHLALLHPYIKVCVNRMLPTLFQYGDVFPTEKEYWIEGGVLLLHSSSHLPLATN